MNEFFRKPLLQGLEEIERLFAARITEKELEFGLFRVPVPNFDKRAFREAFVNALVHRDYSRLGAIHIQIDDNGLSISNPGGFVEGVNLDNLLVAKPHPRNPLLADISNGLVYQGEQEEALTVFMKDYCVADVQHQIILNLMPVL